jgi:hypothetical protein
VTQYSQAIGCLIASSRGFLCSSGGKIHFFERTEDGNSFKKQREEALPTDLPVGQIISAMAISPTEDYLVCTTNMGQIYIMVITQSELADAARVC